MRRMVIGAAALVLAVLQIGGQGGPPSPFVQRLPKLHALLNGFSGALLVAAWLCIRRRWIAAHVAFVGTACLSTAVFLVSYLYYHAQVGSVAFQGTGWVRPHGIAISPHDGKIHVVDGVTTQVHVFDPITFAELNPGFLTPNPGDKIVDLAFRPEDPTPARTTSWGRVKASYRR